MNELFYLFANKSTYIVCIDMSIDIIRLESSYFKNCYIKYKRKLVITLNKNIGQWISITRIWLRFSFWNELVQKTNLWETTKVSLNMAWYTYKTIHIEAPLRKKNWGCEKNYTHCASLISFAFACIRYFTYFKEVKVLSVN